LIGKENVKSEDDVIGFVQQTASVANEQLDSTKAELTVANEQLDSTKAELTVANERLDSTKAELSVANERLESAVGFVVDGALATGRIAPKDKDAWTGKLREDFGSVANELDAIAPGTAMHVESETGGRGAHRPELGDPKAGKRAAAIRSKALSIANEHTGMSWQQCWEQAESTVGE